MTRILAALRALDTKKWITLNSDFKLDLRWFLCYAELANGRFYYTPNRRQCELECDSSLLGGGGVAGRYYYSWLYAGDHTATYPHIHHLEAINLIVAYRTLAPLVAKPGDLVVISTDNISSSQALETGRTRDHVFAKCSRELWLLAGIHNHIITIRHKHGALIPLADALSRCHHDHAKDAYVRTVVARDDLIAVSPSLEGYRFFTADL